MTKLENLGWPSNDAKAVKSFLNWMLWPGTGSYPSSVFLIVDLDDIVTGKDTYPTTSNCWSRHIPAWIRYKGFSTVYSQHHLQISYCFSPDVKHTHIQRQNSCWCCHDVRQWKITWLDFSCKMKAYLTEVIRVFLWQRKWDRNALLTEHEVKMAGYWRVLFLHFYDRDEVILTKRYCFSTWQKKNCRDENYCSTSKAVVFGILIQPFYPRGGEDEKFKGFWPDPTCFLLPVIHNCVTNVFWFHICKVTYQYRER